MNAAPPDALGELSKLIPLVLGFAGGVGVPPLEVPAFCSPSLINASTALSKLPFSPLRTVELRFSSGKPMSRSVESFESIPSPDVCMLDPKTLEGLFTRGGETFCANSPSPRLGETGGEKFRDIEALRSPNPNLPEGFGGNGGGLSSELVLPVLCRVPGAEAAM